MSERLTEHDMVIDTYTQQALGEMRKPAPAPTTPKKPAKEISPDIQKRIDAYNAQTISEALNTAKSRRGESKKEIARLEALLEVRGVTKKTTIADAKKAAGQ